MIRHDYKKTLLMFAVSIFLFALAAQAAPPKYVFFFIGDGMGPEQVKAGGMYAHGAAGTLSFESLPYQGYLTTYSADNSITDSAAAGTALATSFKVNNGVISVALPGDGSELLTLLEWSQINNKMVGLLTTTYPAHATPAAFGAHDTSRSNYTQIANDLLTQTRPNILFGGGDYMGGAASAGYTVVTNRSTMQSLNTETVSMVSGQFGSGYMPYEYDGVGDLPHLSEMVSTAINILDNVADGFFIMVEGGMIDQACHVNDLPRCVHEVVEFSNAVQVAINWVNQTGNTDVLILVTADHETGGMTVTQNNGIGNYPTVTWSTTGHSGANVPVYAWGINAPMISGVMDNTEMFGVVTGWTKIDDRNTTLCSYDASWGQWNGNPGYQNTEMFSETTGGTATFSFTGTKARYYGFKRNDLGYADIYIDGVYQTTVDCYSSTSQYNILLYESPLLSAGAHTLNVQVAGLKNASSSGTEVIVDAFAYATGGEADSTPPAAPTGLAATAGNGSVTLDWADNTEGDLASYNVYRSTTSGSYGTALATGITPSSYTDSTVTNGTTYYYVVTAVDTSSNESAASNEASATPTAPQTLYPGSYAVSQGTYSSGTLSSLTGNDNDYLVIASQTSGTTRYATTDFIVSGISSASPASLALQVITKSSSNTTAQKIYLYNYTTFAWDQKDSVNIGTKEATRDVSVTSGTSSYISGGELQVRIESSKTKSTSFNLSHELICVTVTQ